MYIRKLSGMKCSTSASLMSIHTFREGSVATSLPVTQCCILVPGTLISLYTLVLPCVPLSQYSVVCSYIHSMYCVVYTMNQP